MFTAIILEPFKSISVKQQKWMHSVKHGVKGAFDVSFQVSNAMQNIQRIKQTRTVSSTVANIISSCDFPADPVFDVSSAISLKILISFLNIGIIRIYTHAKYIFRNFLAFSLSHSSEYIERR